MENMWKEIMGTDSGVDFSEWIYNNYRINQYDAGNKCFRMDSAYGYEYSIIKESIINNLAVEWLDSKGVYISICPDINYEVYCCNVGTKTSGEYIDDSNTRQEATAQGVKKAFELLNKN